MGKKWVKNRSKTGKKNGTKTGQKRGHKRVKNGTKWVKNKKKGQILQYRPFNIFFIVSLFNISAWFLKIQKWDQNGNKNRNKMGT